MPSLYKYVTRYTASRVNWMPGRQGNKVRGITIHHWGASRGLDFQGIVNFLCSPRPNNPTSAHYVAQGVDQHGRSAPTVACIVDPDDTAYHAGNWAANLTEIGIECRPYPTEADYRVVAALVRNLRETYGDVPLYPHRHWTSTECPGNWNLGKIDQLARNTNPTKLTPTQPTGDWFDMATPKQIEDAFYNALVRFATKADIFPNPMGDDSVKDNPDWTLASHVKYDSAWLREVKENTGKIASK